MEYIIEGIDISNVGGHGIHLDGERQTTIRNVTIRGAAGDGIRIGRFGDGEESLPVKIKVSLPDGIDLPAFVALLQKLSETPAKVEQLDVVKSDSPWMKKLEVGEKTVEVANTALKIVESPALATVIRFFQQII